MNSSVSSISVPWLPDRWSDLSLPSKVLFVYGVLMAAALVITYIVSIGDTRSIRGVGVWAKPMKFMAATALFAWTTVWIAYIAGPSIDARPNFKWIVALIIVTSLFEVVYITYQGSLAAPSHYNTTDPLRAALFGLMALAAVGLTASQAWLAWEIWQERGDAPVSVVTLAVLIGLAFTFVLSTISGFMLGGHQPPAGTGLPIVGWHLHGDVRPSHFLGVHAQQFLPLLGLFAERHLGSHATVGVAAGSAIYLTAWLLLARLSVAS